MVRTYQGFVALRNAIEDFPPAGRIFTKPKIDKKTAMDAEYVVMRDAFESDLDIVRCQEAPRGMVVSDALKTACFNAKLHGLLFYRAVDMTHADRSNLRKQLTLSEVRSWGSADTIYCFYNDAASYPKEMTSQKIYLSRFEAPL